MVVSIAFAVVPVSIIALLQEPFELVDERCVFLGVAEEDIAFRLLFGWPSRRLGSERLESREKLRGLFGRYLE